MAGVPKAGRSLEGLTVLFAQLDDVLDRADEHHERRERFEQPCTWAQPRVEPPDDENAVELFEIGLAPGQACESCYRIAMRDACLDTEETVHELEFAAMRTGKP